MAGKKRAAAEAATEGACGAAAGAGDASKGSKKRCAAIPKAVRQNVWTAAFGGKGEGACAVCSKALTVWDFDVCHKVSRANGGSDDYDNLFVGCAECNRRQGAMNLDEYLKLIGRAHVDGKRGDEKRDEELEDLWRHLEREEAQLDEACKRGSARPTPGRASLSGMFGARPTPGRTSLSGLLDAQRSQGALRTLRSCLADLRSGRRREKDFTFVEGVELDKFRKRCLGAQS